MTRQKYFYVYYSYEPWGRGYIGKRECWDLPEEDIKYFGSYIDKTFKPTEKIILETFNNREEVYVAEKSLHDFYQVHINPHFANKSKITSTGFCFSASGKDNPFYGGKFSSETIEKLKNCQKSLGENHHSKSKEFRKRQAEYCRSDNGPSKSLDAKVKMSINISKALRAMGDNHPSKSEKFKQSIKKYYAENGHPCKGRKHTKEEIEKMKAKAVGRNLGIKRSLEEIQKSRNNRCNYIYTLISPNNQIIETPFLSDICKEKKLNYNCLLRVCKGDRSHYKGWKIYRRPRFEDDK
jgi:hypothetical protein